MACYQVLSNINSVDFYDGDNDAVLYIWQVVQLTYVLNALLDGRELTNTHIIQAFFIQGLVWSLGAALLEDGRVKFDEYLKQNASMTLIEPSVALAGLSSFSFLTGI